MRELTNAELEAVSGGQTLEEYALIVALVATKGHALEAITTHFPTD
jgi:bacteriocin-like protein